MDAEGGGEGGSEVEAVEDGMASALTLDYRYATRREQSAKGWTGRNEGGWAMDVQMGAAWAASPMRKTLSPPGSWLLRLSSSALSVGSLTVRMSQLYCLMLVFASTLSRYRRAASLDVSFLRALISSNLGQERQSATRSVRYSSLTHASSGRVCGGVRTGRDETDSTSGMSVAWSSVRSGLNRGSTLACLVLTHSPDWASSSYPFAILA